MFESFLKITTAFRNTTLHFIGRENEKLKIDIFKRISKLRLEKQIFFYGYQPKEKVIQLLNKAHIAVFPSKGETFGLALCEVMAMQIPVVCSNIEAFNEIVVSYENGLIANNDLDFSNKCIELFSNNNLVEKIKINSRNTILEKFSLDKMAHESILYYKKVINKN